MTWRADTFNRLIHGSLTSLITSALLLSASYHTKAHVLVIAGNVFARSCIGHSSLSWLLYNFLGHFTWIKRTDCPFLLNKMSLELRIAGWTDQMMFQKWCIPSAPCLTQKFDGPSMKTGHRQHGCNCGVSRKQLWGVATAWCTCNKRISCVKMFYKGYWWISKVCFDKYRSFWRMHGLRR